MSKNITLIGIMRNSIYPFQFNKDCGEELLETYYLMYDCCKIIKNNKDTLQTKLNWNNDQYNKLVLNNLTICDLIYMLTHTYLKYSKETLLFHNILLEIESMYFTLYNDENIFFSDTNLQKYYQQIKEIHRIYYKLKRVYTKEIDNLLTKEDQLIKLRKKNHEIIENFYREFNSI